MPIYRVIQKATGRTVYAYSADAPVVFPEYPEADFMEVVEVSVREDGSIGQTGSEAWTISKRAFWNRFPATKEVAMRSIMATGQPTILAASLQRLSARVDASPNVVLTLDQTRDGVMWLASEAVPLSVMADGVELPFRLSAEEATAILDVEPQAHEGWRV